jgi:aminoglycoside phosphotransferase (APT) family kinase protein
LAQAAKAVSVPVMETPDQIEKALSEWAVSALHRKAGITGLKRLSGGASQETWSFDVSNGQSSRGLILRRAPGGGSSATGSESIGLATEAKLIGIVHRHGVPVPEVLGISKPGSALGNAFIMERVAGETIGRKILRDPEFAYARGNLTQQCGEALARIHAVPRSELPPLPESNALNQIEKYETVYRKFDLPRPVFELALAWLKANPPKPRDAVMVHGDFRLGNIIVANQGLASVLDWELCHLGDPREDISWLCTNSWRFGQTAKRVGGFGDLDALLDAYAEAGGARFSVAEIDWWEMLGSLKWGVMCMMMYGAFQSGADHSIERAAIGRRVSETEIDLINLFERVMAHA